MNTTSSLDRKERRSEQKESDTSASSDSPRRVSWFTTAGTSPAAVYNTIWAAYHERDLVPDEVVIFRLHPNKGSVSLRRELKKSYNDVEKWIHRFASTLNKPIDVHPEELDEQDYKEFAKRFYKAVVDRAEDYLIIDITPGRKFVSALGMNIGMRENVKHIFYLHLIDRQFEGYPYPEIPKSVSILHDFMWWGTP